MLLAMDLFKKDKIAYIFDVNALSVNGVSQQVKNSIDAGLNEIRLVVSEYDHSTKSFSPIAKKILQQSSNLKEVYILSPIENSNTYRLIAQLSGKLSFSDYMGFQQEELCNDLNQLDFSMRIRQHYQDHSDSGESSLAAFAIREGKSNRQEGLIIVAIVRADSLSQPFQSGSSAFTTNVLSREDGTLIASSESKINMENLKNWQFLEDINKLNLVSGVAETLSPLKNPVLASYARVGIGKLIITSFVDRSSALSAIATLFRKSAFFFIVLISFATIASVFASIRLTASLKTLSEATAEVAHGNFDISVPVTSSDEIGILSESFNKMATQVSQLMQENVAKARMEKELETAKAIQETLLPNSESNFSNVSIAGSYEPASECGGDWWHYEAIGNQIFMLIGDVSGHGASAALMTSAAKSAASIMSTLESQLTPSLAMGLLNKAISQTSKGKLHMTFFLGALNPENGELTYCNAGHNPPYLVRHDPQPTSMQSISPLNAVVDYQLGWKPDTEYTEAKMTLQKGDQIIFYTDGVTSLLSPEKVQWGKKEFLRSVITARNAHQSSVCKIRDSLKKSIDAFRQGAILDDDITFFICEYGTEKLKS